ncbi:MAG: hypothetical protein ACRDAI_01555 [Candidatus Rhabdochlamydia sp.]
MAPITAIKQRVLPIDPLKDRDNFSSLALNALGVLGNLSALFKKMLDKGDSDILSYVKCLSFVSAGNNFDQASINIEKSTQIKDAQGKAINEVKLVRSAMQFLSGTLYFSSLGLSWVGSIASLKTIVVASKIFNKTTSVLSNSAMLLMLLITSMRVHEQLGFQQELNRKLEELEDYPDLSLQEKEEALIRFLKGQISLSEPLQEKLKVKLQERYNNKSIEDITNSKKPYYRSIDDYVARRFPREVSKKELAKIAYMKRVTNRECIELIKEMDVKNSTLGPTIQKVQEAAHKNIMFNFLAIGLAGIGLLGLAVSFIPGSAFITLSTILGLIPTMAFSALGIKDLVQSLQSNKEGLYDRLLLLATGCVGVLTSAALYTFTEHVFTKCVAILLTVIWLSLLYCVSLHLENQPKSA